MSGLEKPSNVRFVSYDCRMSYVEMDYMKLLMIKEAKWDDKSQTNWFINNSKLLASIPKSWLILTKDKTTLWSPTLTPFQVVNWNPNCSWMHYVSKCIPKSILIIHLEWAWVFSTSAKDEITLAQVDDLASLSLYFVVRDKSLFTFTIY